MSIASTARVPTANGSPYLQQLCKHWSHNLEVEFTPETGRVVFPRNARGADWPGDATLHLTAQADALLSTASNNVAGGAIAKLGPSLEKAAKMKRTLALEYAAQKRFTKMDKLDIKA